MKIKTKINKIGVRKELRELNEENALVVVSEHSEMIICQDYESDEHYIILSGNTRNYIGRLCYEDVDILLHDKESSGEIRDYFLVHRDKIEITIY